MDGEDLQSGEGSHEVKGPSGASYTVLNADEVAYWDDKALRYVSDNKFKNVSDLLEVDRLVMMELMCWRWSNWLSLGRDYWSDPIDEAVLQKQMKDWSTELRLIKKGLGIDKGSRDKDRGDSIAEYIENLGRRAKEFGVVREAQLTKALVLFNELQALITLYDNSTEDERREFHCGKDDVFQWIRETAMPEFRVIDEHFRQNAQRMWIKSL